MAPKKAMPAPARRQTASLMEVVVRGLRSMTRLQRRDHRKTSAVCKSAAPPQGGAVAEKSGLNSLTTCRRAVGKAAAAASGAAAAEAETPLLVVLESAFTACWIAGQLVPIPLQSEVSEVQGAVQGATPPNCPLQSSTLKTASLMLCRFRRTV